MALLANAVVEPALCRVEVGWKGLGAAYLERSFETLVWLGFFWCWAVVAGREPWVVLGLEEISRAEIWRVICPIDAMVGFAVMCMEEARRAREWVTDADDGVEDKKCGEHEVRF